jgi:hypothetical protein
MRETTCDIIYFARNRIYFILQMLVMRLINTALEIITVIIMKLKSLIESAEVSLLDIPELVKSYKIDETSKDKTFSGNLNIIGRKINSLRGCYKKIEAGPFARGNFGAGENLLTSLEFGPSEIAGHYAVNTNKLTSLKYSPKSIPLDFMCSNNLITSLADGPQCVGVGASGSVGSYDCRNNKISSLHDVHKHIKFIDYHLYLSGNPIKESILGVLLIGGLEKVIFETDTRGWEAFNIVNKYLPNTRGRTAVIECQKELIEAGLEEFAKL